VIYPTCHGYVWITETERHHLFVSFGTVHVTPCDVIDAETASVRLPPPRP